MSVDQRIAELGIELPSRIALGSGTIRCRQVGELVFLGGHGPADNGGNLKYLGKVDTEVSIEDGYSAARLVTTQLLRSLRDHLGSLEKVREIVKVSGFVNSGPEFTSHGKVIDGCSDLLVQIFGARGLHVRSALGVSSLPNNQAVEIEMIVAVTI